MNNSLYPSNFIKLSGSPTQVFSCDFITAFVLVIINTTFSFVVEYEVFI